MWLAAFKTLPEGEMNIFLIEKVQHICAHLFSEKGHL